MKAVVAKSEEFRVEEDALGEVRVPAEHLWGAQTQRSRLNFTSRRRAAPLGPAGDPRVRPLEKVRGAGEPRARATAEGEGRTHRPRGSGRHRRQARRRVSAGRISDRVRHPVQHERQRGDRQPGDPDRRRRHRIQEADPSQRRRQSQSVVERRVPDRDAHRRRSDRSRKRCCRPSRSCAIRSTTRRKRFQTS